MEYKTAPPPPYGFNPSGPPANVVYTTQPQVMSVPVGPESSSVTCPSCHATVMTRVIDECTTKTHLIALLLCLVGCWPCACMTYCMDSCKAKNHYCPSCGAFLGTYDH